MLVEESRQARDDLARRKRPGRHDPQPAMETVDAARRMRRLVEVADDPPRSLKKHSASVGRVIRRVVRSSSFTPRRASRLATMRETEGCDRPNSRATLERLPVSAARTKTESS